MSCIPERRCANYRNAGSNPGQDEFEVLLQSESASYKRRMCFFMSFAVLDQEPWSLALNDGLKLAVGVAIACHNEGPWSEEINQSDTLHVPEHAHIASAYPSQ
ncbi:hypothetical protein AVEN_215665-1 [Araneus ventricosus]|uniref:Uncharacterized protein n=1 Tax=Araneus ventricosus TaxID=182803 RepID=A0A4Y2M075_ARAVE|nr:hypothetical protein AVEN_215665-1 [Araneus ventricosus]